jgi:hypothetical protein
MTNFISNYFELLLLTQTEMENIEGGNLEFLRKLSYIDFLISHKATGNIQNFTQKIEVSKSTLMEYLKTMREELGAPIVYSKSLNCYYYEYEWNLEKGLKNQKII